MESKDDREYLYLDRILYPVTSLGPGNRLVMWVSGCRRHCDKCANPELWERKESQKIEKDRFTAMLKGFIKSRKVDGITISGGEPMDQAGILSDILEELKKEKECPTDILSFTGYSIKEVYDDDEKKRLAGLLSVIIDGEYIDGLNDGVSPLRGSTNQNIIFTDDKVRDSYEEYMKLGRSIQNFVYEYEILSVGIHKGAKDGED